MSDESKPLALPKKKKCDGGGESWITSFADLMTLLLTFFILIVSFSNTELIKFRQAMGALQGATGALTNASGTSIMEKQIPRPDMQEQVRMRNPMEELLDEVESGYKNESNEEILSVERIQDGLVIRMGSSLAFEPGEAQLRREIYQLLDRIARLIIVYDYNVVIEGHTDNVPITTSQFPTNWDLSAARALNVLKYFVDRAQVNPNSVIAIGRGQYKPLAPNDTPENRSKNRRVEIYLNYMYLSGKDLIESRNMLE